MYPTHERLEKAWRTVKCMELVKLQKYGNPMQGKFVLEGMDDLINLSFKTLHAGLVRQVT